VKGLGEQSGEGTSPTSYSKKTSTANVNSYAKGIGQGAGAVSVTFGDTGTASRFFKQVQE
jgi:hypothetical protein